MKKTCFWLIPSMSLLFSCAGWGDNDYRVNIHEGTFSLTQTLKWSGGYLQNEVETDDFVFASLSFASITETSFEEAAGHNAIRDQSREEKNCFSIEIVVQTKWMTEKTELDLVDQKCKFIPDEYCFDTSVVTSGAAKSWDCSAVVRLIGDRANQSELNSLDFSLCGYTDKIYHGYHLIFE